MPDSLFRIDDVLLASLEIPLETASRALRRGWDAGMFTILNPAPAPSLPEHEVRELFSGVMMITPNRVEALTLAGMTPDAGAEPDWSACGLRLKMGPAVVAITLGSRGCYVIDAKSHSIPAPRVEAVDTVAPATLSMGRWQLRWRMGNRSTMRSPGPMPPPRWRSPNRARRRPCRSAMRSTASPGEADWIEQASPDSKERNDVPKTGCGLVPGDRVDGPDVARPWGVRVGPGLTTGRRVRCTRPDRR